MISQHDSELLHSAIHASLAAGAEILKVYGTAFTVDIKEDKSPLTQADKNAHKAIMQHLEGIGIPVLSEEGKEIPYEERKDWKELWVVDPLDGTKEFIRRNGEFTVNIALVRNSEPVGGVIYAPVTGILYFGFSGLGSFRTEAATDTRWGDLGAILGIARRLPLSDPLASNKVVASRSHLSPETEAFIETLRKNRPDLELISSGSSLKLCLVAEGTAFVYPRFAPTMEWDTAAGDAIARAAGFGVYLHDENRALSYNKENLLNPWFIVR